MPRHCGGVSVCSKGGGILIICFLHTKADKDDKRWVWGDNDHSASQQRSFYNNDPQLYVRNPGYQVTEENFEENYYPVNNKPPLYVENRPVGLPTAESVVSSVLDLILDTAFGYKPQLLSRPGGVYGQNSQGSYGQGANYYPEEVAASTGVLTGPVPSWIRQGPFKNYDKCKCTEKFNCPSPGIAYGHCDTNKQYCCIATKDKLGGPEPSRPIHSIENGILAGPGGPVDPVPLISTHPRPPSLGAYRPQRPGGFGIGPGGRLEGNVYSPENGVLVGPNAHNSGFGLGRSRSG